MTTEAAAPVDVECRLGFNDPSDVSITSLAAAGGADTQTVSLAGTAEVPGDVQAVLCSGPGVGFADADILATRVGTLERP